MLRPEYLIKWRLNHACNFRCPYCFQEGKSDHKEHPDCGKYSPAHIAGCLDRTGRIWEIQLGGGEPFLYPDFLKLAKNLTEKHYIDVLTNLSTNNVYKFADTISPKKVCYINAEVHITERTKIKDGLKMFVDKFLYLQNKGFHIKAEYVLYPPLFSRVKTDLEFLKQQGLKKIFLKPFEGIYDNKEYPLSYTEEEKELFTTCANIGLNSIKILNNEVHFFGRLCYAGQKLLTVDVSGNLGRCSTIKKCYGNLFSGKYKLDNTPQPCSVNKCKCAHEGYKFLVK